MPILAKLGTKSSLVKGSLKEVQIERVNFETSTGCDYKFIASNCFMCEYIGLGASLVLISLILQYMWDKKSELS